MRPCRDCGCLALQRRQTLLLKALPTALFPPPFPLQTVDVTTGENVVVPELEAANAAKPIRLPGPDCVLQGRC